jgi:hypothetical protein
MKPDVKNIKISTDHHDMIKKYCDASGKKIYKVIEKLIEDLCKPKKKDLYGE